MQDEPTTLTAFAGQTLLVRGPVAEVVLQAKARLAADDSARIALFDDASGAAIDIDFTGTPDEVIARLADHPLLGTHVAQPKKRSGPGRPKLGVVSREVSLLPRHWQWLRGQRGGASGTLRRLVDDARRRDEGPARARAAQGATHRFMWDMAGDLPGFEEASRAFYANDWPRFAEAIADWPPDLREHIERLVARQRAVQAEVQPN